MTYDVCLRCIRMILPLMTRIRRLLLKSSGLLQRTDQSDLIIAPWPRGNIQTYDDVGNDMEVIQN